MGVRVQTLDYSTEHMDGRHDSETGVRDSKGRVRAVNVGDDSGGSGASATDAAIAVSQLPVLGHFRKGLGLVFAILAIVVNFAALVGLLFYFRTSCTSEYGVLPNESGDFVPPSLANLADQGGVTIISRSLVYYQANSTFTPVGTYWSPFEKTCGCSECNLASCAATIPVVVEYEQCHPWAEVLALSAGLIVYVNVALTALFAVVLGMIPCSKNILQRDRPSGTSLFTLPMVRQQRQPCYYGRGFAVEIKVFLSRGAISIYLLYLPDVFSIFGNENDPFPGFCTDGDL